PVIRRADVGDDVEGRLLRRHLHEALEGLRDVPGDDRPAVQRRLRVPLGVLAQRERPGRAVLRRLPRLGKVAFHDVGVRADARPLLRPQEPAVEHAGEGLAAERDVQVGVERRRVLGPVEGAHHAAFLGGRLGDRRGDLGAGQRRDRGRGGRRRGGGRWRARGAGGRRCGRRGRRGGRLRCRGGRRRRCRGGRGLGGGGGRGRGGGRRCGCRRRLRGRGRRAAGGEQRRG